MAQNQPQDKGLSAKELYSELQSKREPYITRAIECAKLTIPHVFHDESDTGDTKFKTPYQSVGARGVNNLTSKLALALFPPNEGFFKLGLSTEMKQKLINTTPQQYEEKMQSIEQNLMRYEQSVYRFMEENQIRITATEALRHLVISGNGLIFLPPDRVGAKFYSLHNYVVQRDGVSTPVTIITKDKLLKRTLPPEAYNLVADKKDEDVVEIYTKLDLVNGNYEAFSEVDGIHIPNSEQTYPKDKCPYILLRMTKNDGEDYGRSIIEEYLGDLTSLEKLSKALVTMASISARTLYLVNPNGITRPKLLQDANEGDFVSGRIEDINPLQLNRYPDMQTTKAIADNIEQRLSFAFLLSSVVQRNAERVTAEEIRTVASELEDTLSGVYSILTQEFQLPLVRRILTVLMAHGELPQLPEGFVEPTITTGMEALGRGHDFNKFMTFMSVIGQMPDAMGYMKIGSWLTAIATSLGIDTSGLIKTDEEIQLEMQQAQQAQQENMLVEQTVQQGLNGSEV
ncbi:MAG: phage tail protein [Veillonella sp.]|nr:phage tail protein [Veillonella sp.]